MDASTTWAIKNVIRHALHVHTDLDYSTKNPTQIQAQCGCDKRYSIINFTCWYFLFVVWVIMPIIQPHPIKNLHVLKYSQNNQTFEYHKSWIYLNFHLDLLSYALWPLTLIATIQFRKCANFKGRTSLSPSHFMRGISLIFINNYRDFYFLKRE